MSRQHGRGRGPALARARVAALVIATVGTPGCEGVAKLRARFERRVQAELEEAAEERERSMYADPDLAPQQELADKLTLYQTCLGSSQSVLTQAWEIYFRYIDPEQGTPRHRRSTPHLPDTERSLRPCRIAVDKGAGMPPALPEIERSTAEYLEAGQAFSTALMDLREYYEQATYEADGWVLGRALADVVRKARERWQGATEQLSSVLTPESDKAELAMLNFLERTQGRNLRYHTALVLYRAKAFAGCAVSRRSESEECRAVFEGFSSAAAELTRYRDEHPNEALSVFWLETFSLVLDEFAELGEQYMDDKPAAATRSSERLFAKSRELGKAARNLRFEFPREG